MTGGRFSSEDGSFSNAAGTTEEFASVVPTGCTKSFAINFACHNGNGGSPRFSDHAQSRRSRAIPAIADADHPPFSEIHSLFNRAGCEARNALDHRLQRRR